MGRLMSTASPDFLAHTAAPTIHRHEGQDRHQRVLQPDDRGLR